MFNSQVPVANGGGSNPFSVDVPRNTRFLFSNRTVTPSKAIAKSIVRFSQKLSGGFHYHVSRMTLSLQYVNINAGLSTKTWRFSTTVF